MTALSALLTPILETIAKSSVILSLTFVATLALRRQSAALRHTVWTIGLLSALALPLFSLMLPAWHVEPIRVVPYSTSVIAPQPAFTESGTAAVSPPMAVPSTPSRLTPERMLLVIWLIGFLSAASLLFREVVRLTRVTLGSSTVQQSSWLDLARDVSNALRLTRPVRLMRNPHASVLGTWGTVYPRVLLPRESDSWTSERMRVVLGHELAHVKRNDWLVQVIAEIARAIHWFNPLFWIACVHLCRESEQACDDAAIRLGVELGIDGPRYAGHILDLARTLKHSGQPRAAALAMASTSNLERRLIAMLNPSLNRRVTAKTTAVIVAFVALDLTLPLATMRATETVQMPAPPSAPVAAIVAPPQRPTATPPSTIAPNPAMQSAGQISGRVNDPGKALIPGVQVVVTGQNSGSSIRTLTNGSGYFVFPALTPDTYSMRVTLKGFQDSVASAIPVKQGQEVQVEADLRVGPSTVTIDVEVASRNGCPDLIGTVKADGTRFTAADCPLPSLAPERRVPSQSSAVLPDDIRILSSSLIPAVPPQPQVTGPRPLLRIGGDLRQGSLVYHPSPVYPPAARQAGIQGFIVLGATINEDGTVQSIGVIDSSNPVFVTPTIETVRMWTFKPTLLNMQPIATTATITVNYAVGQ